MNSSPKVCRWCHRDLSTPTPLIPLNIWLCSFSYSNIPLGKDMWYHPKSQPKGGQEPSKAKLFQKPSLPQKIAQNWLKKDSHVFSHGHVEFHTCDGELFCFLPSLSYNTTVIVVFACLIGDVVFYLLKIGIIFYEK